MYFLIITQRTLPETTFLTSFHEVPHQADIVFPPVRPRNPPRARRPSASSGSSRVPLPCSRISPFPSQTPPLCTYCVHVSPLSTGSSPPSLAIVPPSFRSPSSSSTGHQPANSRNQLTVGSCYHGSSNTILLRQVDPSITAFPSSSSRGDVF